MCCCSAPTGSTLRGRQGPDDLIEDTVEQVPQGRKRQRCLRLDRPADQHRIAPAACCGHASLPQGRLPDPGFAFEHEGDRAGHEPVKPGRDPGKLSIASEDLVGHPAPQTACGPVSHGIDRPIEPRQPGRPIQPTGLLGRR